MGVAAMIMLYAGLRIGEVLALEWNDIDFEKRTISISKARIVVKNRPSLKAPKNKAGVRIILSKEEAPRQIEKRIMRNDF